MHTQRYFLNPIFFTLFLIAVSNVVAPSAIAADAVSELRQVVTAIKSANGEFEQFRIENNRNGEPLLRRLAKGKFKFLKPGRFIWETVTPYPQVLQSDGQSLYLYEPDIAQVTRLPLTQGFGDEQSIDQSPAGILFLGIASLDKNFTLKPHVPSKTADQISQDIKWVEALPKKPGQFKRIGIGLSARQGAWQINAMELYDSFGQATLIQFSNVVTPATLKQSDFNFQLPANVELIQSPLAATSTGEK